MAPCRYCDVVFILLVFLPFCKMLVYLSIVGQLFSTESMLECGRFSHACATRTLCCRAISRRLSKASSTGKTRKSGCSEAHGTATCSDAKKNWLLQPPCRIQPASCRLVNAPPSLTIDTTARAGARLSRQSALSRSSILAPVTGHWETI